MQVQCTIDPLISMRAVHRRIYSAHPYSRPTAVQLTPTCWPNQQVKGDLAMNSAVQFRGLSYAPHVDSHSRSFDASTCTSRLMSDTESSTVSVTNALRLSTDARSTVTPSASHVNSLSQAFRDRRFDCAHSYSVDQTKHPAACDLSSSNSINSRRTNRTRSTVSEQSASLMLLSPSPPSPSSSLPTSLLPSPNCVSTVAGLPHHSMAPQSNCDINLTSANPFYTQTTKISSRTRFHSFDRSSPPNQSNFTHPRPSPSRSEMPFTPVFNADMAGSFGFGKLLSDSADHTQMMSPPCTINPYQCSWSAYSDDHFGDLSPLAVSSQTPLNDNVGSPHSTSSHSLHSYSSHLSSPGDGSPRGSASPTDALSVHNWTYDSATDRLHCESLFGNLAVGLVADSNGENEDAQDLQIPSRSADKTRALHTATTTVSSSSHSTSGANSASDLDELLVTRRNERERTRVKHLNEGYKILRHHLPQQECNKRLSKVQTLRMAIDYIRQLENELDIIDDCS